jgi:hypothetical protein
MTTIDDNEMVQVGKLRKPEERKADWERMRMVMRMRERFWREFNFIL